MKRIKIAFDLDGVLIDKPPLIPKYLIERWFRGNRKKELHYKIPKSKLEIIIRKLSHFYLLRPPIKQNIEILKKLSQSKRYKLYIISGRYSFLKDETSTWLKKRGLKTLFKRIYLNRKDLQPFLFKEKVLKKIKADIYIDDDNLIADYLANNLKTKVYCYGQANRDCVKAFSVMELSVLTA